MKGKLTRTAHGERADRLEAEAELLRTWDEILAHDPSLGEHELHVAVDRLIDRKNNRIDELKTQHRAEIAEWCAAWDAAAAATGVSSDKLREMSSAERMKNGAQPEFVNWGGQMMKRGQCSGTPCVACDRLGHHLEPVVG